MSRLQQAWRSGHEGRPGWRLSLEYDEAKVEALKRAIPHTHRAWDPANREWWVALEYEQAILELFPEFEVHLHQLELPL